MTYKVIDEKLFMFRSYFYVIFILRNLNNWRKLLAKVVSSLIQYFVAAITAALLLESFLTSLTRLDGENIDHLSLHLWTEKSLLEIKWVKFWTTWIYFGPNAESVAVCLESSSCWKVSHSHSLKSYTDSNRFCSTAALYDASLCPCWREAAPRHNDATATTTACCLV